MTYYKASSDIQQIQMQLLRNVIIVILVRVQDQVACTVYPMIVPPDGRVLLNSILGVALLVHELAVLTQIPLPPRQHVLTTHN
jgi:hypothetical protein